MTDSIKAALIAIVLIVAMLFGAGMIGKWYSDRKWQAVMAEANEASAKKLAEVEKKYRKQEQDHAATIAAIDKKNAGRLKDVQAKNNADLAALRNGALQLHNRFLCPDTDTAMPQAGPGPGLGDGIGGRGLRIADAEFLVSESERADKIAIQLQACQEIVISDRALKF